MTHEYLGIYGVTMLFHFGPTDALEMALKIVTI
jgi:hypothetical protein